MVYDTDKTIVMGWNYTNLAITGGALMVVQYPTRNNTWPPHPIKEWMEEILQLVNGLSHYHPIIY